ncbi:alcohol dehydrogenase [Drechmeria coniospora]|uniref:Alcohol dehydrogenase n=1 Tax=Drechmeria coniospora TaxID=98403 RepID=A0A151GT64_DRECN|nr:alcohol dehydrogenase [Drechmeria coniospora]KYK60260.1 alcohol dehydrogenase [Drechmeria coniospora]
MTTHEEGREYDIIFAGGGTAACVAAGRLAHADPGLSILLVEVGRNNFNDPTIVNPALYLSHLAPGSKTALFYQANEEKAINSRAAVVPAGGVLGGGSSINFMMYTRGNLLPFAKKLETYHLDDPAVDKALHGYDGPVNVSLGTYSQRGPQDDILAAAEALGIEEIVDLQDFKAANGFSRWLRYIGPDGKRQDAAHRYIHPLLVSGKYPNLHLLLESKVSRVLFDGRRATGIEYVPSAATPPDAGLSKVSPSVIRAKKLVVVSAGALGTPSILERSGVGRAELLEKLGIDLVADLPGVGDEYQDHNLVLLPFKTTLEPNETLDGLLSGRLDFAEAAAEGNPILGWNGIDIGAKLRPSDEEVARMGPDFQKLWDRDFKHQTTKPMMLVGILSSYLGDHKLLVPREDGGTQYATIGAYTAYPYSRGNIHIVSKDPHAPASFNTGYLDHPADLEKQLWAYKKLRELYRRTNAYAGELSPGHPKFRPGSKAALAGEHPPKAGYATVEERRALAPIEYDAEDDAAIEDWIRSNVNSTWHSLGTCKMAPKDRGGVVDESLNVHGTQQLKLVDLSIVPENVAANTYNTALIVGEKAADIIGKELGLSV